MVLRFLRESLEMKDLPARRDFVICSPEICKKPSSFLIPDFNFSFKRGQFPSIIPAYRNSWTLDASFGRWTLDAVHWMLDHGLWTLNSGLWMLDSGCWTLDAGTRTLGPGSWTLDSRLWKLNSGC